MATRLSLLYLFLSLSHPKCNSALGFCNTYSIQSILKALSIENISLFRFNLFEDS